MSIPAGFKPNLAATLTKPEAIKFPVYASPKIDGIRCVVFGGVAYSRSLKPIPNEFVQAWVKRFAGLLDCLDGELVVGSDTDPNCMQNSMAVMRKSGEPDFTFNVFDRVPVGLDMGYDNRADLFEFQVYDARQVANREDAARLRTVPEGLVRQSEMLTGLEARFLEKGYEGMMIRGCKSLYKFGRSTEREGGLIKVKRFVDAEAEVIGFVEEMHNGNEAKTDALGRTERSTQASGLTGKDRLGALRVVREFDNGQACVFNIGTGFTAAQREELWNRREDLLGQLVTFKHFDHGTVDAPRHPVFKAFRHIEDT